MQDLPETRQSLLVRVQRDEHDAWEEFGAIYRPAIYRLARQRGWQDADAQDLAQQILWKLASAIARFEPDDKRARFRTWLTTICHRSLVDAMRARKPEATVADGGALDGLATQEVTTAALEWEERRQVFRWAASKAATQFATTTWQAFWQTAVEGHPPGVAAERLGISVGAVYTARSRVMRFLQTQVEEYDHASL